MSAKTKEILAREIQKQKLKLLDWYSQHAQTTPIPFYSSIDLRDSGHKIVPVDSNLYPAGFNNICPEDVRAAPVALRAQMDALAKKMGRPAPKQVLVIPESHTHNAFYIENLFYLLQIIRNAGYEVDLGWYGEIPEGLTSPIQLKSATGKELVAHPIAIEGGVLSAGSFVPDIILLNNDFSGGYPKPLDLVTQPILPSHKLGWHSRKKSEHFKYYNQLAGEFADVLGIDRWLIQIDTEEIFPVNFNENEGVDRVAASVDQMLERTKRAYEQHHVDHKPFVYVKNNHGTYGMGIMVVHSADEIRKMNRRTKNKMSIGKNLLRIDSVVVQEGVPTATLVDKLAAEPVIYLFGCELIGGFLRTNTEKGIEENLNSQGMVFKKLCMSDLKKPEEDLMEQNLKEEPLLELVYGSIARISALATGLEIAAHSPVQRSQTLTLVR